MSTRREDTVDKLTEDAAVPSSKRQRFWYAVLAIVLIGPFILREISPQLEAYPAVLFPSGAMLTQVGDTVETYQVVEVFAVLPDGSEKKVQPEAFLGDIPVQYFMNLCNRHFGLAPRKFITHWSNLFGRNRKWTEEDLQRTMAWMAWRAKETGHPEARAFRFRKTLQTEVIGTGEVVHHVVQYSYDMPIEHE